MWHSLNPKKQKEENRRATEAGPGLHNPAPVQKMIWNLYFLLDHRFCHPKYTPKNQSEGVYREKKIYKTFFVPTKLYNDVSRV